MAILDTTVYVDLRGRGGNSRKSEARHVINSLVAAGHSLTTTRVNVAEMYVGMELGDDPTGEASAIEDFLSRTNVLELDDTASRHYGSIRSHLQRSGRLIGDMDILIGAIALANGDAVVTRNAAHFQEIPGLTVIDYGK